MQPCNRPPERDQDAGGACLAAPLAHAAPKRRLQNWPHQHHWGSNAAAAEPGIKDVAKLGYHGYESLGETLEAWELKGGLGRILTENNMPLPSTYLHLTMNVDESRAARNEEIAKVVRWGVILKSTAESSAYSDPTT